MRIIAGEFRSRKLFTPRDASITRPIPDRVKESLFSLLRGHTEGAAVLDCFAGTGAIGLEALSRGADRCVFVERDKRIAEILRKNIALLGVEDRADVVIGDALGPGALARCPRPVRLAFFDPPYPLVRDPAGWERVRTQVGHVLNLLADDGFLVLRTPWPFSLHVKGPSGVEQESKSPRPERKGKGRKGRWKDAKRREEQEWIDVVGKSPAEIEQMVSAKSAEDDDQEPEQPVEGIEYVVPDLTFSNAHGPETHVYHAMGVHLYARKQP